SVITSYPLLCMFSLILRALLSLTLFNNPPPSKSYTLSLHDALPILPVADHCVARNENVKKLKRLKYGTGAATAARTDPSAGSQRSEEHTSELQSLTNLVCRLLLQKKTASTYEYLVVSNQRRSET